MNAFVREFHPTDEARCSYKCPFYQDGAVHSWCRKYGHAPRYDGNIPPMRVAECVSDTSKSATITPRPPSLTHIDARPDRVRRAEDAMFRANEQHERARV